ncbi:MAG: DUF2442 domain-containing protein [Ignavibacteriae bacterium]|nr:DUF2442 domain-containing protein [Ignavibacteriota bacterium]
MIRIQNVKVLSNYRVELELTNGRKKTIDLEPFLHGPIFEEIKNNPKYFRTVRVDKELGTIVWENGADIDPDVLIEDLTPAWMENNYAYRKTSAKAVAVMEGKRKYSVKKKK